MNRQHSLTLTLRRLMTAAALALFVATTTATLLTAPTAHAGTKPPTAARDGGKADAVAKPGTGKALTGVVNLNTATEEQLIMLPGVGPAKAERILAWRAKHGKFQRVKDLRRVKGFGRKSLQKLEPYLSVTGKTTLAPAGAEQE